MPKAATRTAADVVRMQFDLFNRRDLDSLAELTSEESEWINLPFDTEMYGQDGCRDFMQDWIDGFPDAKAEIVSMIADGNRVAVEFIGRGTHDGTLSTSDGDIEPTGRKMELRFCQVTEVDNGLIEKVTLYFDSASMLRQLGFEPNYDF